MQTYHVYRRILIGVLAALSSSCARDKGDSNAKSRPVVIWESQTEAALKSGPENPMALFACAQKNDLERARELLAAGADPNRDTFFGHCPLHEAAHSDRVEMVKLLLANGAKVDVRIDPAGSNSNRWTPLMFAAYGGYRDVAAVLLEYGADVNATDAHGKRPLYYARDREAYYARFRDDVAVHKFQEIARLLVEHGAEEK